MYKDDGLAVFRNISDPHSEKIKKEFQKLSRQYDLKLIIKRNLKIVDFLDVTLNLTKSGFLTFTLKLDHLVNSIKKIN